MKLFTFSGVSASLSSVNTGQGMIELANHVIAALAEQTISYSGMDDVDHFRSYVNYGTMLSELGDLIRLTGSTVLNEEARRLSPQYAQAISTAMAGSPNEEVLILAHSQGTNNLTWTLLELARNTPEFFDNRSVRCALFDPKVGRNYMLDVFGRFPNGEVSFLFFQSQNDILGNQGMFIPKFIGEFEHGNHIWVKGLDHGSIRDWKVLSRKQYWLDFFGFREFQREYSKEVIRLKQETRGGQLGTMQLLRLDKWINQYAKDEMNEDILTEALLGFLQGKLPAKFKSKA